MYNFTSIIKYSEVDSRKFLNIPSILTFFQDASIFHSEAVGLGLDVLKARERVWFLSSWNVLLYTLPKLSDHITITTSPYDFKGIYGYRNFTIKNSAEEILVAANSMWVFMNTKDWHPAKISEEDVKAYGLESPLPLEPVVRKLPIPKELSQKPSFPVSYTNIDVNHHVNNAQYIKMAEAYLPEDFSVKQLRTDYRTAAVLHDVIYPSVYVTDNLITVVLANQEQKPYVIIEFIN